MSKLLKRAMMTMACTVVVLSMVGCREKAEPTSADVKVESTADVTQDEATDEAETDDSEAVNEEADSEEVDEKEAEEETDDNEATDEEQEDKEDDESADAGKEERVEVAALTEAFGKASDYTINQPTITTSKSIKKQVVGTWDTVLAIDSDTMEEAQLTDVFGSSVSTYGSQLTLNADGTFVNAITPVTRGDISVEGTYKIKPDEEDYCLYLSYEDGTQSVLYIFELDDNQYTIASADEYPYFLYLLKED